MNKGYFEVRVVLLENSSRMELVGTHGRKIISCLVGHQNLNSSKRYFKFRHPEWTTFPLDVSFQLQVLKVP